MNHARFSLRVEENEGIEQSVCNDRIDTQAGGRTNGQSDLRISLSFPHLAIPTRGWIVVRYE